MLLAIVQRASATELFGISLQQATLDQLSTNVKQAGASLIREGGEDNWFDIYDSQAIVPGSSKMYLGYVKKTRKLAFVEYEFKGLRQPQILERLQIKYGKPSVHARQFITDQQFQWQKDGIEITLKADWHRYRTTLSYINPPILQDLKAEQSVARQETLKQQSQFY